jgi:hypothetical protein
MSMKTYGIIIRKSCTGNLFSVYDILMYLMLNYLNELEAR